MQTKEQTKNMLVIAGYTPEIAQFILDFLFGGN
jgi:hypothetical protein